MYSLRRKLEATTFPICQANCSFHPPAQSVHSGRGCGCFVFLNSHLPGHSGFVSLIRNGGGSGDEAGEEGQECEEEEQSVDPAEADTGPETTEIGQVGFITSWQRVEVLFSPDTNQRFSILI